MTTIAYKDGVLAADTAMIDKGSAKVYGRTKIARRNDGALIAACGNSAWGDAFRAWAVNGQYPGDLPTLPEKASSASGAVISADGTVVVWTTEDGNLTTATRPPYFAMGSGAPFALGAMFAGASAIDAVRAAMHHDEASGGSISVVTHENKRVA